MEEVSEKKEKISFRNVVYEEKQVDIKNCDDGSKEISTVEYDLIKY
jgi:hypothetical protein